MMEIIDLDVEGTYLEAAMEIWNAVVLEGKAFPQINCLDADMQILLKPSFPVKRKRG